MIKKCKYRFYKKDEYIFKQGDNSESIFIIIRGSASSTIMNEETGNLPVINKIFYDGDYLGELAHYETSESLT